MGQESKTSKDPEPTTVVADFVVGNLVPSVPRAEKAEGEEDCALVCSLPSKNKEDLLTDEEFCSTFCMARIEFNVLPKWKRDNLKKSKGLF